MVPVDAERIIQDAARADRAYWQLVRAAAEHPRYRLELMERRIEVDAELRGERRPTFPAPEPWAELTLEQHVDRELEELRPRVTVQVQFRRAAKRLGHDCGPVQLSLSYLARVRRRLRQLVNESGLPLSTLAAAMGVATRTLERHLAGDTIPRERKLWYRNVESIRVARGRVYLVVQVPAAGRAKPRPARRRKAS